jgi:cyanate permease
LFAVVRPKDVKILSDEFSEEVAEEANHLPDYVYIYYHARTGEWEKIGLLFLGTTPLTLWVSAAIFGIGLGGDYMIIPLMTAEIFGIEILGRLLGVILTAGGIAEAAAPWFVGRLRDATGSYSASCFVLVGIALLGGFAVLGLPERKRAQ